MNALYRQITGCGDGPDGPMKPATSGHHTARRRWHVAQRGGSFRCCLIPTWVFSDFLAGCSANKLKLYIVLQRFRKFSTLTLKVSKYETSFLKKQNISWTWKVWGLQEVTVSGGTCSHFLHFLFCFNDWLHDSMPRPRRQEINNFCLTSDFGKFSQ